MRSNRYYKLIAGILMLGFALLANGAVQAQSSGSIQGRVVDAADGTPLPGANVIVEGTSLGAATDQNGHYQITNVPSGTHTVAVSYVSYQQQTAAVDVSVGQTATRDFQLKSRVLEGGEVVVTGIRASQSRAVTQKKHALNVVDVLSTDNIGNLPEKNVAEAVQRLPGIVMRNDRSEGRFVSIRGSAAELNNVTLNGHTLASTAGSRATALDRLPAEMVSNIEVKKAVTPDMPANAIGGSININTLSAFDRSGSFMFGSVRGMRHEQQISGLREHKFPYRANLTTGTQLGPDNKWGVVLSASASRRDFTSSGLKGEGWDDAAEREIDGIDYMVPFAQEQIVETHLRERFALNSSLDWRPTEQTSVYFRPYYTQTTEQSLDNELEYNLFGEATPTKTGVEFSQGFGSLDLSSTEEEESLWGGSTGFEQQLAGSITWNASGTFTRGILDETRPDGEFNTAVTDSAGGVADMTNFLFDFYPGNPSYVGDASNYRASNIDVEYVKNTEDTWAAQTDVRIPMRLGNALGYLKTGGALQMSDKRVNAAELEFIAAETVRMADFEAPSVNTVQVGNGLLPFADTDQFVEWFMNEGCSPSSNKFSGSRDCQIDGPYELNVDEVRTEDVENDRDNEEVYAGYGMATFEVGPLTALAGARLEHTITGSRRYQLIADESTGELRISDQNFENSYTDILPSIHLMLRSSEKLQFRAAWTNTIGRPDYDNLSAFREVEVEPLANSDLFVAGVEEGNPDLQPYEATKLDLTAEYYFENGGMASVAGFYKQIDNPIYTFSTDERNVENPFGEGRSFQTVFRTQRRNANDGMIRGLEASYQQPLTYLPVPFNGLGIVSNATFADSEVDVPEREGELPFFEQADLTYNFIPYFQKQGLEVRVAWNFRSDFLGDLGDIPAEDEYVDDRTTVDINASYELNDMRGQPKVMLQVENLTNEPEVYYAGQENHLAYHYLSGRTISLGFSMGF